MAELRTADSTEKKYRFNLAELKEKLGIEGSTLVNAGICGEDMIEIKVEV